MLQLDSYEPDAFLFTIALKATHG